MFKSLNRIADSGSCRLGTGWRRYVTKGMSFRSVQSNPFALPFFLDTWEGNLVQYAMSSPLKWTFRSTVKINVLLKIFLLTTQISILVLMYQCILQNHVYENSIVLLYKQMHRPIKLNKDPINKTCIQSNQYKERTYGLREIICWVFIQPKVKIMKLNKANIKIQFKCSNARNRYFSESKY